MTRDNANESNVYKDVLKLQVKNKFECCLTSSQGEKENM